MNKSSNPASGMSSWVPVPESSDFTLLNLPYGVFSAPDRAPRVGVAIGEHILDLAEVAARGLLEIDPATFLTAALNPFMALGPPSWADARSRISHLLSSDGGELQAHAQEVLVPMGSAHLHRPFDVADYVDFYSSLEHATNLGKLFRPGAEPLLPNWRHLPIGYHGRSGTVVVSGTDIARPSGQLQEPDGSIVFGPTRRLDIELEVGAVVGVPSVFGQTVDISAAADHLFGLVLVNDWSARDIQRWEYQPLGPFLGKSFATSVSPWVVPLDALAPFRVPSPPQVPKPIPQLRTDEPWAFDLKLEVLIQTESMRESGHEPALVSGTNLRSMYWTIAQHLAHLTSNGAGLRTGDLHATGTVSGAEPGTYGSLIELTWNGDAPLQLGGETRAFLEDGDEVTMRAFAGEGPDRIGFGSVVGRIVPGVETHSN